MSAVAGLAAQAARRGAVATTLPALVVRRLGRVDYREALVLQEELVAARRSARIPDTLLLLEHPHAITLGSAADHAHVLIGQEERAALGIALHDSGRGGGVTYHGPGQLVGYPVLALEEPRRDLHRYLRDLEGALIDALAGLGVKAERAVGLTGVWTACSKIAAIGVRISSGWITSHGFALNVSNDLSFFETIVPCGIQDVSVTSVSQELGRPVGVPDILAIVSRAFSEVFGRSIY